ncbi:pyridoxal-phosphate-dependent aminotransferase family protein [Cohnella terricola]|uniref:Alanine--glyoxylate aminotransferase family protein n=1 Tax=Cohnella terricola TaxID=1289167 RepID=A0A559J4T3_9BACL|nr:aminotransferase class V-fold PLP-dependent enzyme [Cohnella terricola]TVX94872.1 alanine--glyoxylate aminotransferase family protein [Cohnella terricola]
MSQQHQGFVPLTLSEHDRLTELLARLLYTKEAPVIIPGEAILGIEAIAAGISAPGRRILNVVTGPYGDIFGKWLERGGAEVIEIKVSFDEVATAETVAAAIDQYKPVALSFVHAESVTGGTNPTEEILKAARNANLITIVDSVSAIGAEPVRFDEWGIDFVTIGAQKALAGPNGVSAVGISPRGWEFITSNERAPRNSILSLLDLRRSSDDKDTFRVPANIPVLEARALIEALERIEEEGLATVHRRHRLASSSTIAGLKALGLEPWQVNEANYAPLNTTVRISRDRSLDIAQPIGIVAPGDGAMLHQLLRINHYGANASLHSVEQALTTLAELTGQDPAAAIAAGRSVWEGADER